jgi:hypothetical protein
MNPTPISDHDRWEAAEIIADHFTGSNRTIAEARRALEVASVCVDDLIEAGWTPPSEKTN